MLRKYGLSKLETYKIRGGNARTEVQGYAQREPGKKCRNTQVTLFVIFEHCQVPAFNRETGFFCSFGYWYCLFCAVQ